MKNALDTVADRIVNEVSRKHKIISAPCEGVLVDELRGTLGRLRRGRKTKEEFILAGIERAVKRGDLERFDDEYGIIIALPNEWPPSQLADFSFMSDDDFRPLYDNEVLRHLRGTQAWEALLQHYRSTKPHPPEPVSSIAIWMIPAFIIYACVLCKNSI